MAMSATAVTEVTLKDAQKLPAGSVLMFKFGSAPAMLIHHQDGRWVAMTAVCTHLGCTVQYEPQADRIHCACHGGVYNPYTGANVSGPPPKPLKLFKVAVNATGVDVSRAIDATFSASQLPRTARMTVKDHRQLQVYDWVDERLGLSELAAFARHKTVPVHSQSFWYYWGGISLFLFLVQCFTGVLLLVYYRPGAEAYESVRQITFVMHFGWLIRSAHAWSANLMIFSILVHMFSVFFMKAYRKPREFGWLSGMALLGLASVFGFSGYLLPMDELSYFATKVGLEIPTAIPLIGPAIANMLRGGPDVSEFTVQRFFALHVVVLPALFLPLLGFHLWLVQRHGNAVPPSEEAKPAAERKSMPFLPNFLRKDLAMWLISLNILALLASVFPWALGKQSIRWRPRPSAFIPSGTS